MNNIIKELNNLILEPKREKLIDECFLIVSGHQPLFAPYYPNPKYFEIWFYGFFQFNYIFLGNTNYVVNVASPDDEVIAAQVLGRYSLDEQQGWKVKQQVEFEFFKDSWRELENMIHSPIRCFLIEYGVIRGIDVNKGNLIDGEEIANILSQENIAWR